ncbi:hypothetical protein [Tenacibaculum litopenaei]|jgi:hypothetical protein|uniref:hypothetical protein n=1 Tax=Tenacibaculum litopenaei TaxID=396016 RepID=UPI0038B58D63
MKLKSLKNEIILNSEELYFISGGTATTESKKNDINHNDSDRSDGGGCIPPFRKK